MGIVIEHEVGSGVKKAQQKVVQKELSADDTERSKGAWSYGEVTQPSIWGSDTAEEPFC
jgi:hypothetical protein